MVSGQREIPKPDAKNNADELRRAMNEHLQNVQREIVAVNAEVMRLTNQENALASEVSTEQARWSDLNQRLEELERSLRPLK
jgi:hypothetical protein